MVRSASQAIAADVAVVGGGPAGLMAAIAVAERGRRVVVLEQLDRPGAKLLASGGGRCNLTNTLPPADFLARFGRQGRFMQPAIEAFGAAALRRLLDSLGVATHAPDGLHVYPVSNSAVTVQSALWRRAKRLGVAVRLATRASRLWIEQGAVRGLETSRGRVAASRVILASGGRGYPALGGSAVGYDLARQAGHTVTDLVPALVPLLVREAWVRSCAGVSLPARVWIDLPRRPHAGAAGDVLFTHRGLSGPVVLDLSGEVSALLARRETVPLRLDLSPGTTAAAWLARFDMWERSAGGRATAGSPGQGRKTFAGLLEGRLPRRLAAALCGLAEIAPGARPSQVSRAARRVLADFVVALPLTATGTEGWSSAMVTRGGVSLREVESRTLASRRVAGLAFAGEILDLDGPSGGFNLQWAFSSGHLAGQSIADCGLRIAD